LASPHLQMSLGTSGHALSRWRALLEPLCLTVGCGMRRVAWRLPGWHLRVQGACPGEWACHQVCQVQAAVMAMSSGCRNCNQVVRQLFQTACGSFVQCLSGIRIIWGHA